MESLWAGFSMQRVGRQSQKELKPTSWLGTHFQKSGSTPELCRAAGPGMPSLLSILMIFNSIAINAKLSITP